MVSWSNRSFFEIFEMPQNVFKKFKFHYKRRANALKSFKLWQHYVLPNLCTYQINLQQDSGILSPSPLLSLPHFSCVHCCRVHVNMLRHMVMLCPKCSSMHAYEAVYQILEKRNIYGITVAWKTKKHKEMLDKR